MLVVMENSSVFVASLLLPPLTSSLSLSLSQHTYVRESAGVLQNAGWEDWEGEGGRKRTRHRSKAGSRWVRDFEVLVYMKPPFRGLFVYQDCDILKIVLSFRHVHRMSGTSCRTLEIKCYIYGSGFFPVLTSFFLSPSLIYLCVSFEVWDQLV